MEFIVYILIIDANSSIVNAILDVEKEWGLKPCGKDLFTDYRKLYFED